jgi:ADP-ribose pyrophosphatase YjhB (NUDIX family)
MGGRKAVPQPQPFVTDAQGRNFACSAVAVQAIILDADERILLASPTRNCSGEWQIISGSLEAAETGLAGVLREVREAVGPQVQVRPLGVVHTHTFQFEHRVPSRIGVYSLGANEGGRIQPGDDMHDAHWRWWSIEELTATHIRFHRSTHLWMLQRAMARYRLWKDQPTVPLQPALNP